VCGAPLTIFACAIPTGGAPPLRFLQGWVAMLRVPLICCGHVTKPTQYRHFRLPPFAKNAKDGAPHCGGNACKIESLGHPPVFDKSSRVILAAGQTRLGPLRNSSVHRRTEMVRIRYFYDSAF